MFEVTFLSTTRHSDFNVVSSTFLLAAFVLFGQVTSARAQDISKPLSRLAASGTSVSEAMLALPDAPEPVSSSAKGPFFFAEDAPDQGPAPATPVIARRTKKNIAPGQPAPRLDTGDKLLMGFRSAVTPFSTLGWVFSAGFSHVRDGPPNYGTNSTAFAQRLGAAAARNESEGIFSTGIMAPLFHEDPRYYMMGRSRPVGRRILYAATRAFVTRTDDGRATPNYALFAGNLAGAALANAYYPPQNRGFGNTAKTFGLSISSAALSFEIIEFYPDALKLAHLKKDQ